MKRRKSTRARKLCTPKLSCLRSALTNGSALLPGLDHRGAWARRLRDLVNSHCADLGGQDALSSAEQALVRRAAMLCLQLELMESQFARNEDGQASSKQLDSYGRTVGNLRRVLETLGLGRRAKDVTPPSRGLTVDALIEQVRGEYA